jgi:PTH1 family peptidyl-tRNA hydrolase
MINSNLDKIFDALRGLTSRKDTPSPSHVEITGGTFLIVGLGNPGREYRNTRHNVGFMLVDEIADRLEVDFRQTQSKALITDGRYQGNKIILAKPQTYMNKSGHATHALFKFYKLPFKNLLVAYDDVDLPFAIIRMKPSGGSAGHKGVKSIIEQLGTQDFPRLRLGIGRPPGHKQAANYVLKPFSKEEDDFLDNYIKRAGDAALTFIREGIDYAMTQYNRGEN